MVGIESLFKYFYEVDCNLDRYEKETSLVIDMGANTTHVFCMNKGSVDWQSVRRINLGGNQSFDMFSKTLLLKNPQLRSRFTYAFLRDIYEKFTCVALDYKQQLRYFAKKYQPFISPVYKNRVDELNK
jgi:actin-related protein